MTRRGLIAWFGGLMAGTALAKPLYEKWVVVDEPEPGRLIPGPLVHVERGQLTVTFPDGFWERADWDQQMVHVADTTKRAMRALAERMRGAA